VAPILWLARRGLQPEQRPFFKRVEKLHRFRLSLLAKQHAVSNRTLVRKDFIVVWTNLPVGSWRCVYLAHKSRESMTAGKFQR
jgi:hypothetical protein